MQNNSFDTAEGKGNAFRILYNKIVQLWNDQGFGVARKPFKLNHEMARLEFTLCQSLHWWLLEATMSEIVILHSRSENTLLILQCSSETDRWLKTQMINKMLQKYKNGVF